MASEYKKIQWPDGKRFAFTIFDDTDFATIENVAPVYEFLSDLGLRTTKSVWPLKGNSESEIGGATCEDAHYLDWLYHLKERGFEISYHLATYHTSSREETIRALDKFAELFGDNPHCMANHTGCQESIYWGKARLTGFNQLLYSLLTLHLSPGRSKGHIYGDPLFWGDLCKERIRYTRNFVFPLTNTLKACPLMPYHDPKKPFVNYWFASSEGSEVNSFNTILSEKKQDQLEEEGGACIIYTHLARRFYEHGSLNKRFESLLQRITKKNGWFVPVTELLDFLLTVKGHYNITNRDRSRLERKWLWYKLWRGRT